MTEEMLNKRYIMIGLKIAYYRKMRLLTQEQLAERAGLSLSFLSQVEAPGFAQSISLKSLFNIAEALEIEATKLIEFDM